MFSEVVLKRSASTAIVLCFFMIFGLVTNVFAGPSLEDLPRDEISEMLESSRAKSKSDIKALMNLNLVVPGGNAKSGLTVVGLHDWSLPGENFFGFSKDSATFVVGRRKWITWWDVKTLSLKRVVLVEGKRDYLFGASSGGERLLIGKAELDGNKSEFDFAVYDGQTLKELVELEYNKNSQKEIFGDFSNYQTMEFAMSPGGSHFMMAHGKGPLQVWDANTGRLVHESYNYNNKTRSPDIDFSGDGSVALVQQGGGNTLYSLSPFRRIRDIKAVGGTVVISPKGTYLTLANKELEKVAGGGLCAEDKNMPGMGFTLDEKYWLVNYKNGVKFHAIEGKGCPEIGVVMYETDQSSEKGFGESRPAPDGKHFAFRFFVKPQSGNVWSPRVRVWKWKTPDDSLAKLRLRVDRGLELYRGGLKKQGLAKLASLVETDGFTLWNKNYDMDFAQSGLPLHLVGAMLLNAAKEYPEGIPYIHSQYAIYASQAKQPFLAAKAVAEVNRLLTQSGASVSARTLVTWQLANALALKVAGRNDDAYTALLEMVRDETTTPEIIQAFERYPDAFAPFLTEPDKVALALDIDKSLLPKPGKEGQPQDYPDLQGNIVKVMPPATPTVNEKQTGSAGQPAPPVKKKKSSVILE